jgi:membrane protease YdiL (CAAX protease family)
MLIYLSAVILLAALLSVLLTPAVFTILLQLWPEMPWPFSRVLDRVFLVAIVVLLYCFRRRLKLSEIFQHFVWPGRSVALFRVGLGFLLAFVSAWGMALFLSQSGLLEPKNLSWEAYGFRILKTAPAALLIAVIEEIFFRLLLLKALMRVLPIWGAAFLGSIIYSLLHFVAPDKSFIFEPGNFLQGFSYAVVVGRNALQSDLLMPIFGLFLVGLLLSYVALVRRSLLLCIGLHAGWIMALKLTKAAFDISDTLPQHTLAARYFLVGQPLVWLSFLILLCLLLFVGRRQFMAKADLK